MTSDMRWECLLNGNAWRFMKLSTVLIVIGLVLEGYTILIQGPDTLGGVLLLLFVALWSGFIGIVGFALATVWLLMRSMTSCR